MLKNIADLIIINTKKNSENIEKFIIKPIKTGAKHMVGLIIRRTKKKLKKKTKPIFKNAKKNSKKNLTSI